MSSGLSAAGANLAAILASPALDVPMLNVS